MQDQINKEIGSIKQVFNVKQGILNIDVNEVYQNFLVREAYQVPENYQEEKQVVWIDTSLKGGKTKYKLILNMEQSKMLRDCLTDIIDKLDEED